MCIRIFNKLFSFLLNFIFFPQLFEQIEGWNMSGNLRFIVAFGWPHVILILIQLCLLWYLFGYTIVILYAWDLIHPLNLRQSHSFHILVQEPSPYRAGWKLGIWIWHKLLGLYLLSGWSEDTINLAWGIWAIICLFWLF